MYVLHVRDDVDVNTADVRGVLKWAGFVYVGTYSNIYSLTLMRKLEREEQMSLQLIDTVTFGGSE
jgi:hypothetical protein